MKVVNKLKIQCATVEKSKTIGPRGTCVFEFSLCYLLFRLLLNLSELQLSFVPRVSLPTLESDQTQDLL